MPAPLTPEQHEWRLYFCMVGELWQAVRDKQPPFIVEDLLSEIQALGYTTSQDLLHRQCQSILSLATAAPYRAGA